MHASSSSARKSELDILLGGATQIWRGREIVQAPARSTGFAALDAHLPGGGWPLGALIEILPVCEGLGEISLLLPALRSWGDEGRSIVFVRPPHIPYAPALAKAGVPLRCLLWVAAEGDADAHWSAEQLLRAGAAAVLLWSAVREDRALRRLQLAAEAGKSCGFLYRAPAERADPGQGAAAIRLALSAGEGGLGVQIVKARGGRSARLMLPLPLPAA